MTLSVTALFREITDTLKVKKEIAKLEQEARALESKNQDLKNIVGYLNSPAYKEKAARENLNLKSEGEVAVALPSDESSIDSQETIDGASHGPKDNMLKWWKYFFERKQ